MARTTENFHPNVTLGDLLVLSRLADLFYDQDVSNPGQHVQTELKVSPTRVRNALLRIDAALGSVELAGKGRRTQQPSLRGANVGMAAQLAAFIIQISEDPLVDQTRLRLETIDLLSALQKSYGEGKYNRLK